MTKGVYFRDGNYPIREAWCRRTCVYSRKSSPVSRSARIKRLLLFALSKLPAKLTCMCVCVCVCVCSALEDAGNPNDIAPRAIFRWCHVVEARFLRANFKQNAASPRNREQDCCRSNHLISTVYFSPRRGDENEIHRSFPPADSDFDRVFDKIVRARVLLATSVILGC